jgi:hypothetical protein
LGGFFGLDWVLGNKKPDDSRVLESSGRKIGDAAIGTHSRDDRSDNEIGASPFSKATNAGNSRKK